MKKSICLVVALVMMVAVARAQQGTQDFLISQEDTSCHFSHSNPILFPNGNDGFLVVWNDTRNGPAEYYAQQFDSLGNSVGKNFPIYSDEDMLFTPDGSFFVENQYNGENTPFNEYYLYGRTCKKDGTWSDLVMLANFMLPFDCIGVCIGVRHNLTGFSNGYLSTTSLGGSLSLSKQTWDGSGHWNWYGPSSDTIDIASISTCFTKREDYCAVWVNVPYYDPYSDTTHEIMGTFFDSDGDVLAEDVLLESHTPSIPDYHWWEKEKLNVVPVSDSLYEIFVYDGDAFSLDYWKVDRSGNSVGEKQHLQVYCDTLSSHFLSESISNFSFTPMVQGEFSLVTTIQEGTTGGHTFYNTLLAFDQDGDMVSTAITDSSEALTLGKYFFRRQDSTLLIPNVEDGDIYLESYRDFGLLSKKRINDDGRGSNDNISALTIPDTNSFFVTWTNELHNVGSRIDKSGAVVGAQSILPTDDLQFFKDGKTFGLWTRQVNDSSNAFGYDIYDKSFLPIVSDTLAKDSDKYLLFGDARVVGDSSFLVLYRDGSDLNLRRVWLNGSFKEITVPTNNDDPWSPQVFPENDTTFWIRYSDSDNEIRLVSDSLTSLGNVHSLSFSSYLGGMRFLVLSFGLYQFSSLGSCYGRIESIDDSVLTEEFLISDSVDAVTSEALSDSYFAVAYRRQDKIFVKTFDANGTARTEPLQVSSNFDCPRTDPMVEKNGNRLLTVWSEARTPGKGYDVCGSLLDIDKITSVDATKPTTPNKFTLYQNYPNPFNPSTMIIYQIPAVSHTVLKIYDVLGREVATLVDERKSPGTYEVRFDGSKFASGVYFCQMTAGNYVSTRKLLLLK